MSMFFIGLSSTHAQIGELGIYGSVPEQDAENIYYVYLQDLYPPYEGSDDHFLPVNGLKNFNFYYSSDGTGFVPAGTYRVWYYAANKTTNYGYDTVSYSPNSDHTNGEEVRPFNIPDPGPELPLGIHGVARGYDSEDGIVDLHNLQVWVFDESAQGKAKTNGDGYFSVYYGLTGQSGFLETGVHPDVWIFGSQGGCNYFKQVLGSNIIWSPSTSSGSSYFVSGATFDMGTLTLDCD